MSSLKRPRVILFVCLAVLALLNVFLGGRMGDYAKNTMFIILIIIAAVALVVMLVLDRRGSDRRSLTEHARDVQRAMEAEEKYKR